jgi:alcohol dehydrogenase class IV
MSYWFNAPGMRFRAPLGSTSGARGLSSTLLVPKIFMGVNAIPERGGGIVRYIAPLCSKKQAFIICDKNVGNLAARVSTAFKNGQFKTQVWDKAEPEVPLENVNDCAKAMTAFEPDLIVAVGGGSVMDLAKAAWILYERPDITDLKTLSPMTSLELRKKACLLAVPTTSGTGSECTSAAVLTDLEGHRKVPIASRELVPDFAVIDPTFTMGMPPKLTAGTGLDALAHAMDNVMSPASNDITDALALKAIELVFKYLPRAYHSPRDREARYKMHVAATTAGIAFGNGSCALTHSLGHALGKVFNIHHGIAVGIFIPATLQFYSPVTDKYLDVCKALDIRDGTEDKSLANLVAKVRELLQELDLPLDLKGLGISKQQLENNLDKLVIDSIEDPDTFGTPRPITEEQCQQMFRYVYEGKDIDF